METTTIDNGKQERFQQLLECLGERPRDVDLLIQVGNAAEGLARPREAFLYLSKAFELDSSKRFLIPKLRACASPEEMPRIQTLARRPAKFLEAIGESFSFPVST